MFHSIRSRMNYRLIILTISQLLSVYLPTYVCRIVSKGWMNSFFVSPPSFLQWGPDRPLKKSNRILVSFHSFIRT